MDWVGLGLGLGLVSVSVSVSAVHCDLNSCPRTPAANHSNTTTPLTNSFCLLLFPPLHVPVRSCFLSQLSPPPALPFEPFYRSPKRVILHWHEGTHTILCAPYLLQPSRGYLARFLLPALGFGPPSPPQASAYHGCHDRRARWPGPHLLRGPRGAGMSSRPLPRIYCCGSGKKKLNS